MIEIILNIWNWIGNNAAVIVALSAFFVAFSQRNMALKHNKLSVKPHLADYSHTEINDKDAVFQYTVSNNGIGPAEIVSWQITLDGEEISTTKHETVENYINHLLKDNRISVTVGSLLPTYVMSVNEKQNILTVKSKINSTNDFTLIKDEIDKLNLVAKYKSMYGDEFVLDSNEKS